MTAVFNLFAFNKDDEDGSRDTRRDHLPASRLADAVEWAVCKGYDTIMLEQTWGRPSSTVLSTHHVCNDPVCPGGC